MPGVWKKTLQYLGLVEDEDLDDLDDVEAHDVRPETGRVRHARGSDLATIDRPEAIVRTMPTGRVQMAAIHRAEPKRFNEAREIGERFRQGVPVIMNLQGTEDATARRLVDFASGLVFGLDGKIETVASRVYLLTPANLEVSAEERERLVEGGFFNQF
jgi:cell division inhibitor SepF